MGKRREARERAVQFLFQHDLNAPENLEEALDSFWESQRAVAVAQDKGAATWGQKVELPPPTADETATRQFAENLELPRMAAVDRNILRLGVYEMLFRNDIPPVVTINEAVEVAKKFSTRD